MKDLRNVALVALIAFGGCGGETSLGKGASNCEDAGHSPSGGRSGASAAGGTGASSGAPSTGGVTAVPNTPGCSLPRPPPLPNPTAAETERAELALDFCKALQRDGCLPLRSGTSRVALQLEEVCSPEELLVACAQDQLLEYHQHVLPECDDEWRVAIQCAGEASYPQSTCTQADLTGAPAVVCVAEKQAFRECRSTQDGPRRSVSGSRDTCTYGPGSYTSCEARCPGGENDFRMQCNGPPGLPQRCQCFINSHATGDTMDFGPTHVIYVGDCADAAARMANGEVCTNRLDCCFEYTDGGEDKCRCGSDPNLLIPPPGFPTCEAAAQALNGRVVDICPQWEVELPP